MRALFGITFIAIFDTAQVAAIALRVFKEGHEVGNRDDAIGALQPRAISNRAGIAHIAAIAATVDREAALVEARIGFEPVEESGDVLD